MTTKRPRTAPGTPRSLAWIRERCQVDEGGCWLWQRGVPRDGYGRAKVDGKNQLSHRVALAASMGVHVTELPRYDDTSERLSVLHSCNVKRCCNPAHLRLGTHAENMADALAAGTNPNASKTHCPRGHEYDDENTRIDINGKRHCRTCNNELSRKYRARRRAQNAV